MTVAKHTSPPFIYSGLSSDTKPDATVLSVFVETDTGDEFIMLSNWTQCKDALSQFATLSTLIAGERYADQVFGYIQTYGTVPRCHEPNMTAANFDAWALNNEIIIAMEYRGAGGVIVGDTVSGEVESKTVLNTAVYGIQVVPTQFTRIYQQGTTVNTSRAPSTGEEITAFASDRDVTLYLTGSLST